MLLRIYLGHWLNDLNFHGEGVEVGVQRGEFSDEILKHWSSGRLYMVDCWRHQSDDYYDSSNGSDEEMRKCFEQACRVAESYPGRATIVREMSVDAARRFENGTLDFVYIDANHAAAAVLADLEAWWPKVRPGGILSGHDYICDVPNIDKLNTTLQVKSAVDKFAEENDLRIYLSRELDFKSWWVTKRLPTKIMFD